MNDSSMIKILVFHSFYFILFFYGAVSFYKGMDPFNNKRITTQNVAMKILLTKLLPIIFIIGGIWFSGRAIIDYTIKDYQTTTGVLEDINAPYRDIVTEQFYVEGENDPYYLPKGFLKYEEHGKTYEFTYGKRSRIIIQIREITP